MLSRTVVVVAWLAITTAAGAAPAAAATLQGRITDRSGQPLPGVVVSAVNAATTATQSTVTDADGRYHLDVPDGRYDMAAQLAAFQPGARRDVAAIGEGAV